MSKYGINLSNLDNSSKNNSVIISGYKYNILKTKSQLSQFIFFANCIKYGLEYISIQYLVVSCDISIISFAHCNNICSISCIISSIGLDFCFQRILGIMQKEQELLQPLIERAKTAINEVAKEKGYTYILDTGTGVVVFFDDTDDITPFVKKKLGIL